MTKQDFIADKAVVGKDCTAQAQPGCPCAMSQETEQNHKTNRRCFSSNDAGSQILTTGTPQEEDGAIEQRWRCANGEQMRTAIAVQQLRRQMDKTIAKEERIRMDTQRRQQDAVRLLAEAAGELVRRLDVEECPTKQKLSSTQIAEKAAKETTVNIEHMRCALHIKWIDSLKVSVEAASKVIVMMTYIHEKMIVLSLVVFLWWLL